VREAGQGCTSCVHRTYCPELYWFMRYTQRQPDDYNGRACASWSNNEADKVKVPTSDDTDLNTRNNNLGILTEPNRSGITDALTAGHRDRF
jgi:hypothetical protein